MSDEIVVQAPRGIIKKDALEMAAEQRELLGQYIKGQMQEGVDYGVIPGTKNRTLLKPGAEKLTDLYRCTPKFTIVGKTENWQTGFFHYTFRCRLMQRDADAVLAEGFGSCSSFESKYRWRNANRKCPQCGKESIIAGKQDLGGGWVCWKKRNGCGAKFATDDPKVASQVVGRVENEDLADVVNTVLKMAKKRAHVDASIALAGCSDLFTQDMDDEVQNGDAPVEPVSRLLNPEPSSSPPAEGSLVPEAFDPSDAEEKFRHMMAAGEKIKAAAFVTELRKTNKTLAMKLVLEMQKAADGRSRATNP